MVLYRRKTSIVRGNEPCYPGKLLLDVTLAGHPVLAILPVLHLGWVEDTCYFIGLLLARL